MEILSYKGAYKVESSKKGFYWIVSISPYSCSCPDFRFRLKKKGGKCKHIKAVIHYLNSKDSYEAMIAFFRENSKNGFIEKSLLVENFGESYVEEAIRIGIFSENKGQLKLAF